MTLDTTAAVAAITAKTKRRPKIAVILGSGLGGLAKDVQDAMRISYGDIPGFRRSTAPGHAGELVVGTLSGKDVAVMNGRMHYYEGYDIVEIGFPVRVFRAWGVRTMIITNACGGLNPAFKAGDLMVLSDHINFMGVNPLRSEERRVGKECSARWAGLYCKEKRYNTDGGLLGLSRRPHVSSLACTIARPYNLADS